MIGLRPLLLTSEAPAVATGRNLERWTESDDPLPGLHHLSSAMGDNLEKIGSPSSPCELQLENVFMSICALPRSLAPDQGPVVAKAVSRRRMFPNILQGRGPTRLFERFLWGR